VPVGGLGDAGVVDGGGVAVGASDRQAEQGPNIAAGGARLVKDAGLADALDLATSRDQPTLTGAGIFSRVLERKVVVAREPDGRMLELAWVA
jgi:hypothetical protein